MKTNAVVIFEIPTLIISVCNSTSYKATWSRPDLFETRSSARHNPAHSEFFTFLSEHTHDCASGIFMHWITQNLDLLLFTEEQCSIAQEPSTKLSMQFRQDAGCRSNESRTLVRFGAQTCGQLELACRTC